MVIMTIYLETSQEDLFPHYNNLRGGGQVARNYVHEKRMKEKTAGKPAVFMNNKATKPPTA